MVNLTTEGPLKMQILRPGWQAVGSFQVPTLILQSPESRMSGTSWNSNRHTDILHSVKQNLSISGADGSSIMFLITFYQLIATVLKLKISINLVRNKGCHSQNSCNTIKV